MKKIYYLAFIMAMIFTQKVSAGDFQEGKGYGTIKLEMFSWNSTQIFDMDGQKKDRSKQTHFLANLRGQYGITKHLNVLVSLPYQTNHVHLSGEPNNQSAMGDMLLGLRYSFTVPEPFGISILVNQSFATSDYDNGIVGLNTGYGDYYQNVQIDLAYHYKDVFYANLSGGGIFHHQELSDALTGKLELGVQPLKELWVSCFLGGINPLENGENRRFNELGSYSNNEGWYAVQPEIAWKHKSGFGIFAGYDFRFKGQWIEACNTIKFGLFYKIHPSDKSE